MIPSAMYAKTPGIIRPLPSVKKKGYTLVVAAQQIKKEQLIYDIDCKLIVHFS